MANPTIQQAFDLALQHHQSGRLHDAEQIYRQILAQLPEHVGATHYLGVLAHQVGRNDMAIELIGRATGLRPNYTEAYNNLGNALKANGQLDDAIAAFRRAIALRPGYAEAHYNLGNSIFDKGQFDEALKCYREAIALRPDYAEAHNNLGNTLKDIGQLDDAIASYRKAVALRPDYAEAWSNLGGVLLKIGQVDEAIGTFRKAIQIRPDFAETHWGLARSLLISGTFAEGWEEFEWRLKIPERGLNRGFPHPQWDGADPTGKTILLHTEGGFGDAIHFIRLVPMLRNNRARFILECQPSLVTLFQNIVDLDSIIARGQTLPPFDWHIPLQSLPRILGITLETIPGSVPYLQAPPDRVAAWAERLSQFKLRKIGLVWAGSVYTNEESRSRSVEIFEPLARVPKIQIFSLQKGPGATQKPADQMNVVDFTAEFHDWAETAAFIQNLDLVISVDTSVAHLAGALAKPVWVLIPSSTDFRWLLNRSDSPWYPTMRLFRQKSSEKWENVVEEMVRSL